MKSFIGKIIILIGSISILIANIVAGSLLLIAFSRHELDELTMNPDFFSWLALLIIVLLFIYQLFMNIFSLRSIVINNSSKAILGMVIFYVLALIGLTLYVNLHFVEFDNKDLFNNMNITNICFGAFLTLGAIFNYRNPVK
ncbi:MAG TPA: hypothetical protein VJY64_01570 [Candidatus Onthovivens sp.]|nr:hypothetical protein [Candidatus Onthovivens sp.]